MPKGTISYCRCERVNIHFSPKNKIEWPKIIHGGLARVSAHLEDVHVHVLFCGNDVSLNNLKIFLKGLGHEITHFFKVNHIKYVLSVYFQMY